MIRSNCCHFQVLCKRQVRRGESGSGSRKRRKKRFQKREKTSLSPPQQPVCLDNYNKDNIIGTKGSWSSLLQCALHILSAFSKIYNLHNSWHSALIPAVTSKHHNNNTNKCHRCDCQFSRRWNQNVHAGTLKSEGDPSALASMFPSPRLPHQTSYSYPLHPVNPWMHNTQMQIYKNNFPSLIWFEKNLKGWKKNLSVKSCRQHLIGISQGHKLGDTFTSAPHCTKYRNTNANAHIQIQRNKYKYNTQLLVEVINFEIPNTSTSLLSQFTKFTK